MKKELGKWLLDIAKYMTTVILLSTILSSVSNIWIFIGVAIIALIILIFGLILVKDNKKEDKI